jgi:tetratricopeptide (TPR) repeat protein
MRYKDTDKSVSDIARELGVDVIIEGSVLRVGDHVRITAQLIDGRTDANLWAESYEREWRDILKLQGEVAQAIAKEIQAKLTPEEEMRLASARRVNPEAHEAYFKGRFYWNKMTEEGSKKSIEYFEQAIEKDPDYALAYAGLADSYNNLAAFGILPPREAMPKAKAAAMKALELDDTLAEAHASLGHIIKNYDWDWAEAERESQRAIELNPNSADAHLRYSMYFAVMGRYDEAIAETERARTLDPLSVWINLLIAQYYFFARQYDQAIEEQQKTMEMDPDYYLAHTFISAVYLKKRLYEEAIAGAQKGEALSGGDPVALAYLGYAYAVSGKRDEAMKILIKLKERLKRMYVAPLHFAMVYMGLDDKDQAFEWLERAYEERDSWLVWLKGPIYDGLRSDPRFTALQKKMNLDDPKTLR